jgi:hypothetical protein
MKFLIGPDQVYFSFTRGPCIKIFFKKLILSVMYIKCGAADPGIVTVRRIFREF